CQCVYYFDAIVPSPFPKLRQMSRSNAGNRPNHLHECLSMWCRIRNSVVDQRAFHRSLPLKVLLPRPLLAADPSPALHHRPSWLAAFAMSRVLPDPFPAELANSAFVAEWI